MGYHTYTMRFTGTHLFHGGYIHAFEKVHNELVAPWVVALYAIGIIAASWHFAYGLWLFAAKWGITVGEQARRKFGYVCVLIAAAFILIGAATLVAFVRPTSERELDTPANRSPQQSWRMQVPQPRG